MELDGRPGNQIKPTAPEPEYAKMTIPVLHTGIYPEITIMVCTRCGCYVWDLQAHENFH